jgi:hypothetical protein
MGAIKPESEHAVLEEAGVAFDPTTQHVDLSKEEKRRTTALLMAIQAYNLIIKDAEMYIAISREKGRDDDGGPIIRPATIEAMVVAAMQFDDFISGKLNTPEAGSGEPERGQDRSLERQPDLPLWPCDSDGA